MRRSLPMRIAAMLAPILASAFVAESASADQLYQTGFEAPTFTAGQTVDGQGGFAISTLDPANPKGNLNSVTVTTDQPHSGSQALLFNPTLFTDSPPPNGPGFFAATAGVTTNYDAIAMGNPVVTLEAWVRLDGPVTPDTPGHPFSGDLVSINLEAILGDGSYFSTYLSSNGSVIAFTTDHDFSTPVALGVYHDLTVTLDFANRTSTFGVDGTALGTIAFDPSVTSTVLSSAQLTMYNVAPPTLLSDYSAHVDDFSVRAVPEPASLLLLAIGGGAALRSLGRRRA